MKTLVKIGGTLLDSQEVRAGLARQIADAFRAGHELAVVHGGGKQITRFLEARGIESQFVNGMRVTTPEILEAVLTVLRNVNRELVQALREAGAPAVALFVDDGTLVEAEQMDSRLGAVGRVIRCHSDRLTRSELAVVACVAGDREGNRYNVNGDQMAVAYAAGMGADRLIFLTDVTGVLDGEGRVIPRLTAAAAETLIANGIAKGGMQAKLNAAASALQQGVREVRIVPGAMESTLALVLRGEPAGTAVVP
ncbi:MAG: acetylglutamate kinase [Acidobacteriota bacterium]|nr:acetylglutamate kinase [Acidobacteriota bacterium]